MLCEAEEVGALSFTGSTGVGKTLYREVYLTVILHFDIKNNEMNLRRIQLTP